MRIVKFCLASASLLALSACAPTVWDRPGTTEAQFSMDSARCRIMAEGATPGVDPGTVSTGNVRRDLAANAAIGIFAGLAQAAEIQHKFNLCMQANGYIPRQPGAQPPAIAASAPPIPLVPPGLAAAPPPPAQAASPAAQATLPPQTPVAQVATAPLILANPPRSTEPPEVLLSAAPARRGAVLLACPSNSSSWWYWYEASAEPQLICNPRP